jgi:rubrerythrin
MELKGSKTEQNLLAAFGSESQARNNYTHYADVAKEEGFSEIADFFEEVAEVEEEHKRRYIALLEELKEREVLKKGKKVMERCPDCPYVREGDEGSDECPGLCV